MLRVAVLAVFLVAIAASQAGAVADLASRYRDLLAGFLFVYAVVGFDCWLVLSGAGLFCLERAAVSRRALLVASGAVMLGSGAGCLAACFADQGRYALLHFVAGNTFTLSGWVTLREVFAEEEEGEEPHRQPLLQKV